MSEPATPNSYDLLVVGAGAAGLMAAISAARHTTHENVAPLRIAALDGAAKLGAKILVAGGGRCNVTNRTVTPADYCGGSANIIRRVLAAFDVPRTVEFFRDLGVSLHEEESGKLFPDSNRAATVVNALLNEARERGVQLLTEHRVTGVQRDPEGGFFVQTSRGPFRSRCLILATGGLSLPRSGSDGAGYDFARRLGHTLVPTTPALDPLLLDGDFHAPLSGITHDAEFTVHDSSARPIRIAGSLLWTHFGLSGPAALNVSRHWRRAQVEGRTAHITLSLFPGADFAAVEQRLIDRAAREPRVAVHNALARWLPERLADAIAAHCRIAPQVTLGQLAREARRALVHRLVDWPVPITGTRGYKYAEVTAGGVPLNEIDSATLQSRVCPGLHLCGEILDVDGRIGGFNFQWAWASGWVAGAAAVRALVQKNRPA